MNNLLHTRKTIENEIIKQKMKLAKDMLENGLSVKQTAFKLGFYDEFHFSKKFKLYYNKPPVDYKS